VFGFTYVGVGVVATVVNVTCFKKRGNDLCLRFEVVMYDTRLSGVV